MDLESIERIRKWLLEVWNDGECKFDYDIHINEIDSSLNNNIQLWVEKSFEFFFKSEELRKKENIPLNVVLNINIKNDIQSDLRSNFNKNDLERKVNKMTPPSIFLLKKEHIQNEIELGSSVNIVLNGNEIICKLLKTSDPSDKKKYYDLYFYFKTKGRS